MGEGQPSKQWNVLEAGAWDMRRSNLPFKSWRLSGSHGLCEFQVTKNMTDNPTIVPINVDKGHTEGVTSNSQ